jgi:PAS domain S-box-containing protein
MPARVLAFVAALAAAAVAVGVAVAPLPAAGDPDWLALPLLLAVLLAATWFVVPFRYGGSVDAVNLVEAALAPLLLGYPPIVIVGVVTASQIANGVLRGIGAVKTAFNAAMWALAAGLGAAVLAAFADAPLLPDRLGALVLALAVVGLVNTVAVAVVLALAEGGGTERLRPVVQLGWLGGWGVNVALGLLLALAAVTSLFAVPPFAVPLVVLHLAYRSYSAARADQARLAASHRAAALLAAPLDPLAAVPDFLRAVATCYDAEAAELVLRSPSGRLIHRVERGGAHTTRDEEEAVASLAGLMAASPTSTRARAADGGPVGRALAAAGAQDCLAAPLLEGDRLIGAVVVLDRGGFAGTRDGEVAIVESLAREAAGAIAKGRLLADVLEERRSLAEIVGSASDGICTFAADGTVLSWNPAMERITGLAATAAVGRGDIVPLLAVEHPDGRLVDLTARPLSALPADVRLRALDGRTRLLTCAYGAGAGEAGATLVVVARDITPADDDEALQRRLAELVEADEARRAVVEQLQQAVVPGPLAIAGAEVAAVYEASDPSEPTGGDLFDWQLLPSGELHLAVVDVLGHGVAATKDALAVVHTLRMATAAGTPLGEVVARADALLGLQHPDLVATAIVVRYDPATGVVRVASGGHPPALVISPDGAVAQVAASGGVIGWPGAGSDDVVEARLEPGGALLLYTDGLIEARKDILEGMEDLLGHASEVAHLGARAMAAELVDRALAGADRRDDTLALVLRRDPVPSAAAERSAGRDGTSGT